MIHTVKLTPDWKLINALSEIDKFEWSSIEKREGHSLKQLKSIATVRSVGASTRIEGSKMTDDEVEVLLNNLKISTLEERDQQEVAGYFEALDTIAESYRDIEISESAIKGLHNILMKYSEKDVHHKGNYKQLNNSVEATHLDGSKHVVFQTTNPGFETENAMRKLIDWYNADKEVHSIVRSAIFVYDFLSIHPFLDGNGRLSRLLGTLLLLKHGYTWVQYISFEHEIEDKKTDYYKVLMDCQRQRPGEDVYPWVIFFLDCLGNIQRHLMDKLQVRGSMSQMTPREKKIYSFVENHPGSQSGVISEKLDIPLPTVKRVIADMVTRKFLQKHGIGAGTNYTVEKINAYKSDLLFVLTNNIRKKEFTFMHRHAYIELKKIVLAPLFQWKWPDEWSAKLAAQGLHIQVTCYSSRGDSVSQSYSIMAYNHPSYFQPVFSLNTPINISSDFWDETLTANDYPIGIAIELISTASKIDFEVQVVYDAMID
ncbi:MAG: Fic family protein [Cyclobacteriaceae bacterium]